MKQMDLLHLQYPFMGSRSLRSQLRMMGYCISRKRVRRLMRLMSIYAIYPRPNTSKANRLHKCYPYLLKDLAITTPNQVWCTDITYILMKKGFI